MSDLAAIVARLDHDTCWESADDIRDCLGQAQADRRALLDLLRAARKALMSEDEIGHGQAAMEGFGGEVVLLGECAYCDGDWPCRTQAAIDRLLAKLDGLGDLALHGDKP